MNEENKLIKGCGYVIITSWNKGLESKYRESLSDLGFFNEKCMTTVGNNTHILFG